MHVTIYTVTMARSEANFRRSEDFLSSRFLYSDSRPSEFGRDRRSILKLFSLGGRACPRKPIAIAEMRLFLARLIWNFKVSAAPGEVT